MNSIKKLFCSIIGDNCWEKNDQIYNKKCV
jgi:hypothetical protein